MPEIGRFSAVVKFPAAVCRPCAAQPTSRFMALLMDPRAVKAQAPFPALFVCLWLAPLLPFCEAALNSNRIADLFRFPTSKVAASARSSCRDPSGFQQGVSDSDSGRARPRTDDRSRLLRDSAQSRGVARDHTSREVPRRGPAKHGEQLLVSTSQNDVPDGAVRKRAVSRGSPGGTGFKNSEGVADRLPVPLAAAP